MKDLCIKEGISGVWYYHLAKTDEYTSLCGTLVMHTSIPLAAWDCTPKDYHIPEKWCEKCKKIAEVD